MIALIFVNLGVFLREPGGEKFNQKEHLDFTENTTI